MSQYLTFALGQETYAVGILGVREIIEYGAVVPIPMVPSFVRGVINLRGHVVPIIDLSARIGRPPATISKRTCVIIVDQEAEAGAANSAGQMMGLVVDAVHSVVELGATDIEPPPSFGVRLRPDFIAGMGRVDGRFIVLLELAAVLALVELSSLIVAAGEAASESPTPTTPAAMTGEAR